MKILIYSYNDKIGDGLQKVSFLQQIRKSYPDAYIAYSTTNTTTLKKFLNPLIENCIDEFIENNKIQSSLKNILISNRVFRNHFYDLIIDLQKVVLRTLSLKKIPHINFFSASANFLFSDYKNIKNLKFKNIYIENFYFNILELITNQKFEKIPNIHIPKYDISNIPINSDIKKNIAIAPGAGNIDRRWPFSHYLKIAIKLRDKGYKIYFFIGPEERNLLEECLNNNFECPEWAHNQQVSKDIRFTMNLAKKMSCLLTNDGGTSWMFQFAGVKTLKIFGLTDAKKFSRPGFSESISIQDYGYNSIMDFPVKEYEKRLFNFLEKL
jgi:ADP-heptose:LPS heptosyltransferase